MRILGFYNGHHSSACLLQDGRLEAVIETEKMLGEKYVRGKVIYAIDELLRQTGVDIESIDLVAFSPQKSNDPSMTDFDGELLTKHPFNPAIPFSEHNINVFGRKIPAICIDHHVCHAANTYYLSNVDESLIFTYDGCGNFGISALVCEGEENKIAVVEPIPFRAGLLLSTIGYYLFGMGGPLEDKTHPAGKLMGLSSYGKERSEWANTIRGWLYNDRYVNPNDYLADQCLEGIGQFSKGLLKPENRDAQDFMATVQATLNIELIKLLHNYRGSHKSLSLGGGCALNCLANSEVLRTKMFTNLFIPPSCYDGGIAIGAAFYLYYHILGNPLQRQLFTPYLGRDPLTHRNSYLDPERILEGLSVHSDSDEALVGMSVEVLSKGGTVAVMKGRSEIGPRALGNRSILADPRLSGMKELLNQQIKHREWYRPYAPVVKEESFGDYFDTLGIQQSPSMLFAFPTRTDIIPATTHVDGTARVQTVNRQQNMFLYGVLDGFHKRTGVPVLLNTSFNDHGKPLVDSLATAIRHFRTTPLDLLIVGNTAYRKKAK